MDVKTYRYKGKQQLVYTNNSPDTLRKVYFHLYPNAFQPGSEMDMRLRSIKDPDGRMVTKKTVDGKEVKESRIKNLKPDEIGYLKISDLKQDGGIALSQMKGTVLEVKLSHPILPSAKTTFTLDFEGQVPVQIRRSGRNNSEGVELSMSQWYPKMAEYDFEGWHADPYIAREFHGVWGDFDVKLTIDKDYVVGGSGYLQNSQEIGHGYEAKGTSVTYPKKAKTLTWHFVAPNVHDFTWAADKKYKHDVFSGPNGVDLHFLYLDNPEHNENWKNLQPLTARLMEIYNETVGNYPYKQYSVIQGGDGGMEYAMCTLIMGNGTFEGLVGVTAHEMAHSWFQHVLASNELEHGWMDEGFTTFLEDYGLNKISTQPQTNPYSGYRGYIAMANSGTEQPLSTHADRFDLNRNYSISSYSKGELFLSQLIYLIGKDNLFKTLKKYYADFQFKHPTPNDITRTAELVSGAHLGWYLTDWTQTTNTIDYGIKAVTSDEKGAHVSLERIGRMPMPIDLLVEYENGTAAFYYIPLTMMHYEKGTPYMQLERNLLKDWPWAQQQYDFTIPETKSKVKSITIDPSGLMADVKPENNTWKK